MAKAKGSSVEAKQGIADFFRTIGVDPSTVMEQGCYVELNQNGGILRWEGVRHLTSDEARTIWDAFRS